MATHPWLKLLHNHSVGKKLGELISAFDLKAAPTHHSMGYIMIRLKSANKKCVRKVRTPVRWFLIFFSLLRFHRIPSNGMRRKLKPLRSQSPQGVSKPERKHNPSHI